MSQIQVQHNLEAIAAKIIPVIVPLEHTQALLVKKDQKLDRIDIKILKEADKLNKKDCRA